MKTVDITIEDSGSSELVIQEISGGALIANHVYSITNDDELLVEFASATFTSTDEGTDITGTLKVTGANATSAVGSVIVTLTNGATNGASSGDDYAAGDISVDIGGRRLYR